MSKIGWALVGLLAGVSASAQKPCTHPPASTKPTFFLERTSAATDSLLTLRLCTTAVKNLASYMATLRFDSTHTRTMSVTVLGGGIHATNSEVPGEVRVAAASPSGFPSAELAQMTFTSSSAGAIALDITEANATSGASLLKTLLVVGWSPRMRRPMQPVIDSISPRAAALDRDRVTDITIYGKGFAATGNAILFGTAEVSGLKSQVGGTVIRFSAPLIPTSGGRIEVRVRHDSLRSNVVTFTAKDGKP